MSEDLLADFMGSLLIVVPAIIGIIFAYWLYKKAGLRGRAVAPAQHSRAIRQLLRRARVGSPRVFGSGGGSCGGVAVRPECGDWRSRAGDCTSAPSPTRGLSDCRLR
jgi:hypothetical protein